MKGIIVFACTSVLLAGCSNVVMQDPFPDSSLTQDEMNTLQGTWQLEDTVIYVHFTTNGSPVMASVEWENGQYKLLNHELHIASRDGSHFLSVLADPQDVTQGHLFAAFKPRNKEILVWAPNLEFFEKQISTEKLKGSVKEEENDKKILLTSPSTEILDLIATNQAAIDFEEPLIFRKLD